MNIHYIAIVVCAFVAFVISSIWYVVFSKTRADLLGFDLAVERKPAPKKIIIELLRTMLLAYIFALILSRLRDTSLHASIELGLLLWVAFPAILLGGSVMWDKVPFKLALIHAGDWLIKLLLIAVIVGTWK